MVLTFRFCISDTFRKNFKLSVDMLVDSECVYECLSACISVSVYSVSTYLRRSVSFHSISVLQLRSPNLLCKFHQMVSVFAKFFQERSVPRNTQVLYSISVPSSTKIITAVSYSLLMLTGHRKIYIQCRMIIWLF
jgi:hypothetical protein